MRSSLFVILILLGSLANAAKTTCFARVTDLHPELPMTLCMNDIGLYDNGDQKWISVYGGNMEGSYGYFEHQMGATAQLEVSNVGGDVCSTQEIKRISIELNKDFQKKIRISKLKVSMEIETNRDTCHLSPMIEVVDYQLIK